MDITLFTLTLVIRKFVFAKIAAEQADGRVTDKMGEQAPFWE